MAGNNKKATEVIYDRLDVHLSGPNPVGEEHDFIWSDQ